MKKRQGKEAFQLILQWELWRQDKVGVYKLGSWLFKFYFYIHSVPKLQQYWVLEHSAWGNYCNLPFQSIFLNKTQNRKDNE
jgi:hypothetical protein